MFLLGVWEWWSRCVRDRQIAGGRGAEGEGGWDPTWTQNKRGTDWGRGHYTTHTTKGWRGEVHGRHNTAKVPLFYPRFISPPSLQIFGGTLWITYWYWEYCALYIVERNLGSRSFSLFKDGCFVLFGFCLLLYLNRVYRDFVDISLFQDLRLLDREAPTGSFIFIASCDSL